MSSGYYRLQSVSIIVHYSWRFLCFRREARQQDGGPTGQSPGEDMNLYLQAAKLSQASLSRHVPHVVWNAHGDRTLSTNRSCGWVACSRVTDIWTRNYERLTANFIIGQYISLVVVRRLPVIMQEETKKCLVSTGCVPSDWPVTTVAGHRNVSSNLYHLMMFVNLHVQWQLRFHGGG
jgi:hypothetical protein